jgi:hypothetical protein
MSTLDLFNKMTRGSKRNQTQELSVSSCISLVNNVNTLNRLQAVIIPRNGYTPLLKFHCQARYGFAVGGESQGFRSR